MAAKAKTTFRDGPYKPHNVRQQISWQSVGETSIHAFVYKLTELGYTVCFSRTMDGSALSLTVMAGEQKIKEYIHPGDDILNILNSILEYADV